VCNTELIFLCVSTSEAQPPLLHITTLTNGIWCECDEGMDMELESNDVDDRDYVVLGICVCSRMSCTRVQIFNTRTSGTRTNCRPTCTRG